MDRRSGRLKNAELGWRNAPRQVRHLPGSRAIRSLLVLGCIFAVGGPSAARAGAADADQIRAAMLLNIARFVNWPAWKLDAASHPQFQVCLLGANSINAYADRFLQHQTVSSRPVEVRHLGPGDDPSACHMLYLSAEVARTLPRMRPELAKAAVLTLSEEPSTAHLGQVIGLPVVNDRVHIDINLGEAQRDGLEISSRLLDLATVTH